MSLPRTGVDSLAWQESDGKAISGQVYELVTNWGGSISAEHGIGQLKRDELARLGDPVSLAMMRAVKQALDPAGLLNPGKLVAACVRTGQALKRRLRTSRPAAAS